jgi:hypothetical protein
VAPGAGEGCRWVGWVCFFCASFPRSGRVMRLGWGLVGGVFDLWIVDASIWQQPGSFGLLSFVFVVALLAPLIGGLVGCVFCCFC